MAKNLCRDSGSQLDGRKPEVLSPADVMRVNAFAKHYPHLVTLAQLRSMIFYAEHNGLASAEAIVRKGRAVYVIVSRFMAWLLQDDPGHQQGGSRCKKPSAKGRTKQVPVRIAAVSPHKRR